MIQRKPIGNSRASIMAEDMRRRDTQGVHQGDDILCHLPLGVDGVIRVVGRSIAFAIAAQIGNDHVEFLGKLRRDALPAVVVLRIAVQKEQWFALAAAVDREFDFAAPDAALRETFDHGAGHPLGSTA